MTLPISQPTRMPDNSRLDFRIVLRNRRLDFRIVYIGVNAVTMGGYI